LFPEFWNTVVNPVLLLIEPVVVMVPVSDVPVTELPRSAPLLSAPSKLKLVSTLMFLMLLVEFRGGIHGSSQRTEDIPGSTIHVVLACEARTVHIDRGGQQCRKGQGGGRFHAFTPRTFVE
jgi:hypothetical protein